MKIEKTTKITLDTTDQQAVSTVLDIVGDIFNQMQSDNTLVVYGEAYPRDHIDEVKCFLTDLWQNGDCACEIKED